MSRPGSIEDLRRALGLSVSEEAEVRAAAGLLTPAIEGWVEAFYARLMLDPAAMAVLADEGRVVRLKRSLVAWFHELFALPLDAGYARMRAEIGRTHLRVDLPGYLMVTAMSGLKSDVRATATRLLAEDPARAARVAAGLEKLLDLDLCLMLGSYADAARQAARRRDRDLLLGRVMRRLKQSSGEVADAAACYAELVRSASTEHERVRWMARLDSTLRLLAGDAPGLAAWGALDEGPRHVRLADLCARVLRELPPASRSRVAVQVEPAELMAVVLARPLEHALRELLDNALRSDPQGTVRLRVTSPPARGLVLSVEDGGPGWPPGATLERLLAHAPGLGLAYAVHVASLHGGELVLTRAAAGGAGVELTLAPAEVG